MQTTSRLLAFALGAAALAASAAAQAQTPAYVRVRNVTFNGTGCPAGSTAINVSPDQQALAVYIEGFAAEVGPGVPFDQRYKFCQMNLDLDFPRGWQYAVDSVDLRGYVSLDSGVTGSVDTTYYFQGQSQQASLTTPFYGPIDRDYELRDTLGLNSVVWSPCGAQRSLNIKIALSLATASRSARGLLTFDDGAAFSPRLRWQRCY
jgi:hypothetical protein